MKAIGYQTMGSLEQADFIEFTTDIPELGGHDLLVEVHGVSINPVDTKVDNAQSPKNNLKFSVMMPLGS